MGTYRNAGAAPVHPPVAADPRSPPEEVAAEIVENSEDGAGTVPAYGKRAVAGRDRTNFLGFCWVMPLNNQTLCSIVFKIETLLVGRFRQIPCYSLVRCDSLFSDRGLAFKPLKLLHEGCRKCKSRAKRSKFPVLRWSCMASLLQAGSASTAPGTSLARTSATRAGIFKPFHGPGVPFVGLRTGGDMRAGTNAARA